MTPFFRSTALKQTPHAFFTRQGGISSGLYATLNGGVGSKDAPEAVMENRRRMAQALGIAPERLLVPYQIHSAITLTVSEPWTDQRPHCDGLATATPGLALGVTGADCGVLLFADDSRGIIGAAHAGWKGALGGIVEATVAAMTALGAQRRDIQIALGPTIGPDSYEVGPEFQARFVAEEMAFARFFRPSATVGHFLFDLPAFIGFRAEQAQVGGFDNLALDTYPDEERFFSYRRATHRKEADYGRQIAAIALPN